MQNDVAAAFPREALQRLEFLVGDFAGEQTLFAPGEVVKRYNAVFRGRREACERFLEIDFFAEIPDIGMHSYSAFLTFSSSRLQYEMWLFSSTSEEPLHMVGDFDTRGRLVMVSDPWMMQWGLQRLRGTYIPEVEGRFDATIEIWEPDGYVLLRSTSFVAQSPFREAGDVWQASGIESA